MPPNERIVRRIHKGETDEQAAARQVENQERIKKREEEINIKREDLDFPSITSAISYGTKEVDRSVLVSQFTKLASAEFIYELDDIEDGDPVSAEMKNYYYFIRFGLEQLSQTERISLLREVFYNLISSEQSLGAGFIELLTRFPKEEIEHVGLELLERDNREEIERFFERVIAIDIREFVFQEHRDRGLNSEGAFDSAFDAENIKFALVRGAYKRKFEYTKKDPDKIDTNEGLHTPEENKYFTLKRAPRAIQPNSFRDVEKGGDLSDLGI
ncbi:MAG: hypothetical protein R3B53_00085 [Candidatus Paceibacterota bacterium]